MSSPCDPKNPRSKGSPSLLWPPHPSWKLCWHHCTESLFPPSPSWTFPALREKKNPKMLFLQCALYSVRKTQKQRLHNSRTNLRGFRNGNYWLWKHWLSRQSSTNYPDPFSLALSLSLVFCNKSNSGPDIHQVDLFQRPMWAHFLIHDAYRSPDPSWQLSVNRGESKELGERSLHHGFAAQISWENRQVPQPLCLSGAAL